MKLLSVLDFSTAGLGAAVKRFFLSLVKTMAAAGIAYILLRLDSVHISNYVRPMYAGDALVLLAGVRSIFAFLEEWLTTSPTQTAVTPLA